MNNYGISKTPWHFAVTVLVLICLAGLAFWIYRKEPIYSMHFFKKHERAFGTAFAIIALMAFLTFDYLYEFVLRNTPPSLGPPPATPLPPRIIGLYIASLAAFVFLRHASRFEICAKICAGGVAALITIVLPWPSTIICAGVLALFCAVDYVVVRPHLHRKRVIAAVRTVSAALFIISVAAILYALLAASF